MLLSLQGTLELNVITALVDIQPREDWQKFDLHKK